MTFAWLALARGSSAVTCPAGDQCNDWQCNPATGTCSDAKKADGDQRATTGMPAPRMMFCEAGAVHGRCTACMCPTKTNVMSRCVRYCDRAVRPIQPRPDGAKCSDGNACTQTDFCVAGVCMGSNQIVWCVPTELPNPGACDRQAGSARTRASAMFAGNGVVEPGRRMRRLAIHLTVTAATPTARRAYCETASSCDSLEFLAVHVVGTTVLGGKVESQPDVICPAPTGVEVARAAAAEHVLIVEPGIQRPIEVSDPKILGPTQGSTNIGP